MTQIDWSKIRKPADLDALPDNVLFDKYETYAGGSSPIIRDDLPDEDVDAAMKWLTIIPDMIGVCLVIGEEGSGKTMFAHALGYDAKYLFTNKRAILDRPPRPLFGRYIPFSTEFLKEELARLQDMAGGNGKVTKDGRWISTRGEVFMRHSVMVLDEFGGRHMGRLTPPNIEPKKSLLSLLSLNRHLQCLFLGVGTELADFDRHFFPHTDYIVTCTRFDPPPYDKEGSNIQIAGRFQKVRFNRDRDGFDPVGEPAYIIINGSQPRDYLDGYAYKDIYHTDNIQAPTISRRMQI